MSKAMKVFLIVIALAAILSAIGVYFYLSAKTPSHAGSVLMQMR